MPGRLILSLGMLLCCASLVAQAPTASAAPAPSSSANKGKAKANLVEAKLALDGAKRWTQAAIDDSAHLQPIEQDILLVRLADSWKEADHQKSHEYLDRALDQVKRATVANALNSQGSNYSFLVDSVSEEIHNVDPKTWKELLRQLPEWEAKDAISREANALAGEDDAGAVELAEQSLARGGAVHDVFTLTALIDHPGSADKLFNEMLSTTAKHEADPSMVSELAELAFRDENEPDVKAFFNPERQQRLLETLAQAALSGDTDSCSYHFGPLEPLIPRYSQQVQTQLRSALADCVQKSVHVSGVIPEMNDPTASTDDLISAMNEASNAKKKASLRQQAARRAADVDHDYEKAIHLCLGASEEERKAGVGSQDLFDRWATVFASAGIRDSAQNNDIDGLQRFLDLLPARIKASPEMDTVRLLAKQDRPKARASLADARSLLEIYEPDSGPSGSERTYIQLLFETARVSPDDIPDAWRIVVVGLNRLERARRVKTQVTTTSIAIQPAAQTFPNALYPFTVPTAAVADEGFVRASIEDLDSVAYREELRLGVIGTFLESYQTALKANQAGSAIAVADSKK